MEPQAKRKINESGKAFITIDLAQLSRVNGGLSLNTVSNGDSDSRIKLVEFSYSQTNQWIK